jgi:5-methylcytosine-specific restriction endonuclease McrA
VASKTCPICGVGFTARKERRTCSTACGNELKRRPHPPRQCEHCKEEFIPVLLPKSRFCSKTCSIAERHIGKASKLVSRVRFPDCTSCGKPFCTRNSRATTCSRECRRRAVADWANARYANDSTYRDRNLAASHARRAEKLGLGSKRILLTYLIDRDSGQCQVPHCCFINRKVAAWGTKGPKRPSIDHITPISKGGEHALHNVQLAHYRCNLAKNNRGSGDQLALIG